MKCKKPYQKVEASDPPIAHSAIPPAKAPEIHTYTIPLSPKETEAGKLLLQALSNKEIAEAMGVSVQRVKAELRTISLKCGMSPVNRIKLANKLMDVLK